MNAIRDVGEILRMNKVIVNAVKSVHDEKYEREDIKFFRACPHFFNNSCKSTNWCSTSPCWKCFKNKKYNPLNAENVRIVNIFEQVKDEKCK